MLSSLETGKFRNHHRFGKTLQATLETNEALEVLPGCGWLNGGCMILSHALVAWSQGALQQGACLRSKNGMKYVDHAFAWCTVDGERWLFDGDGLQLEPELRTKLNVREQITPEEIRYESCARLAFGILLDRKASRALVSVMQKRIGPFSIDLLI